MTSKELAFLFAAAKVPMPEMERMINEHTESELKNFKDFFNSEYESPMPIRQEDIDNFAAAKVPIFKPGKMSTIRVRIEPYYGIGNSTAVDFYKVVDEQGIIFFVGSYEGCEGYIKLMNV